AGHQQADKANSKSLHECLTFRRRTMSDCASQAAMTSARQPVNRTAADKAMRQPWTPLRHPRRAPRRIVSEASRRPDARQRWSWSDGAVDASGTRRIDIEGGSAPFDHYQ